MRRLLDPTSWPFTGERELVFLPPSSRTTHFVRCLLLFGGVIIQETIVGGVVVVGSYVLLGIVTSLPESVIVLWARIDLDWRGDVGAEANRELERVYEGA